MRRSDILVAVAVEKGAAYVPPDFDTLITGMGKVSAATSVALALAKYQPGNMPLVVNIGTCGSLHPHRAGLFTPSIVVNHDFNVGAPRKAAKRDSEDTLHIPDGDGSVLATGDLFLYDPEVRDELAARADLVDMEGYAVAYACAQLGARCRLVRHVADQADDDAIEWPDRTDLSFRELGKWLAAL
ncbi:nucleosidase [Rhodococcus sp. WMMA185]|uniref:nucleosidase n=1 Tax=Rhodococcus sp. WMMA185 TaxID=679318 RepID=UPI000878E6C0|nr:nucleosidase [Rhodococcus sp. WMMA185]AOW92286.1 nucleosidase [Rhodococcus sp. WMMA185]